MIAAWMLYTVAVTTLLFAGASAAEYLARAIRVPARFVWAVAIAAALSLSGRALTRPPEPRHNIATASSAAATGPKPRSVVAAASTPGQRWSHVQSAGEVHSFVNSGRAAAAALGRTAGMLDVARRQVARLDVARLERWNGALIGLCVAASCVAFLWLIGSLVNLRRIERELASEIIDDNVVLVSKDVGPAIFGIVRSRIVLPRWVLSLPQPERHIILTHEQQHAAAFDPALLCAAAVALALQPWNVALWALFAHLRFALETDCDRRVLSATGDARQYGKLLVAVYERTTPKLMAHVAFVERPSDLERRIRRMTRHPRLLSIAGGASAVATLVLSTAAWTMSAPVRRAVSETTVRPRVWQLATVVITGLRADPPPPPPKMGVITVVGAAPQATIPSPELTPPNVTPIIAAPSAMRVTGASSISVGTQGPCKKREAQRPDGYMYGVVSVSMGPDCTIDGDVVMLALDSAHVLVAWRDSAEAALQRVEYVILATEGRPVTPDMTWSTTAGHAVFRGGTFYFRSPSSGVPSVAFGPSADWLRDIDAAALRFGIRKMEIIRQPAVTWDVLRQLPSAPRCTPGQQTIRLRRVGTGATDAAPLFVVDGVVVPADPPPPAPADCFIVDGQTILLPGR